MLPFLRTSLFVLPRFFPRAGFLARFNSIAATSQLVQPISKYPSSPNSINFTKEAVQRLSALALSGDSLNIKVSSGGCHGYQYDLTLVPSPADLETETNTTPEEPNDDDEFGKTELTTFKLPFFKPDKRDLVGLSNSFKKIDLPKSEDNSAASALSKVEETLSKAEAKDVFVVIDSDSLALLNGTTLEFQRELIGSSFKIIGGNLKSSCGCGSSFDL